MSFFSALTPEEITAIVLSLKVALVATIASLPFAILLAHILTRRDFPGHFLLDTLVHLPLVVTGYVLLLLFGRKGPLGAFLEANSASSSPSAGPAPRSLPRSCRFR